MMAKMFFGAFALGILGFALLISANETMITIFLGALAIVAIYFIVKYPLAILFGLIFTDFLG